MRRVIYADNLYERNDKYSQVFPCSSVIRGTQIMTTGFIFDGPLVGYIKESAQKDFVSFCLVVISKFTPPIRKLTYDIPHVKSSLVYHS